MSNKTIINTTNASGLSHITTLTVPASSTDREVVIWDGTSGRSIAGGHGVLISENGDFEDVRSVSILAGPSNPGDDQTVWIRAADGHLMRGEVDLEDVVGGPESASSTDNAIVRWNGTDGTLIQDSTVLLSDANRFTISGQTFLYADGTQRNFFAGRTSLATMTGANNVFVGIDSGTNITDTTCNNNTALGTETLANLVGGSTNLVLGSGAGASYTSNESGNILLHSLGVAGDNNVTRIGTTQTSCYIKGIYGVAPGGTTSLVVVKSDGQLGTYSGTPVAASEWSDTLPTFAPAGFSLTIRAYKVGKMVTVTISAAIMTLGTPTTMITLPALPVEYYPSGRVSFPMMFVSNGVYDTGLVGSVVFTDDGAIEFRRDTDASPATFENDSGWDADMCFTFLTA